MPFVIVSHTLMLKMFESSASCQNQDHLLRATCHVLFSTSYMENEIESSVYFAI